MSFDKTLENSSVIRLLRTLRTDEWIEFEKFADSPYFNKGRNYLPLLKILRKFHPQFQSPEFTKPNLYKLLFGNDVYKESVLNSMLSRLNSIGEEFLLQKEFLKNEYSFREALMLRAFSERGLKSKADKFIKETNQEFGRMKFSEDYFLRRKLFSREATIFHYHSDKRELLFDSLSGLLANIFYSFLVEMHANDFSIYTQRNFWKSDFGESLVSRLIECIDLEKVNALIEKNDATEYPLLRLCYLLASSIKDIHNDDFYDELKNHAYNIFDLLEDNFKKAVLNSLALICSAKFVAGKTEFKAEAFEIRKKAVEENLFSLTSHEYIRTSEFRSTFIEALNLGETQWAENFAATFNDKLNPSVREDVSYFCRAHLAYNRGRTEEAVEFANKVEINQIIFKLDMKNLIAKVYYDTDSIEPLVSHLNAYNQFIKDSESQGHELLLRHSQFIKAMRKLLNAKITGRQAADLALMKKRIEKESISAKFWLIKKIDELLN